MRTSGQEETDDDRCSRCVRICDCGRLAAFAETLNANELAELARRFVLVQLDYASPPQLRKKKLTKGLRDSGTCVGSPVDWLPHRIAAGDTAHWLYDSIIVM